MSEEGWQSRVYHGTGNIESLTAFDPKFTGRGDDALGSGFYFTTSRDTAAGYCGRRVPYEEKIGGEDSPGVVVAEVNLKKPIRIESGDRVNDAVRLTKRQALDILLKAPGIFDMEETPLWNFADISGFSEFKLRSLLPGIAEQYSGVATSILALENDFFRGEVTAFRKALHEVTGYDGVLCAFDDQIHCVVWFPEQIAIIDRIPVTPPGPKC